AFVFAAVLCAALVYRGWFRWYSIGTLVVLMVSGWLASQFIPDIADNLPTPWLGAYERINAYVYLVWVVVLAVTVMRRTPGDEQPTRE
ncbi:MAG: hypothetical protein WAW17_03010, partial [Rhodococcus sp. (in: high G+C Gram-positive bacteria)]